MELDRELDGLNLVAGGVGIEALNLEMNLIGTGLERHGDL